jgi:hypothetical protein
VVEEDWDLVHAQGWVIVNPFHDSDNQDRLLTKRAFRCLKTVDLRIRPIYHWLANRVRAHVFLCMLAHYLGSALYERDTARGVSQVLNELAQVAGRALPPEESMPAEPTSADQNARCSSTVRRRPRPTLLWPITMRG